VDTSPSLVSVGLVERPDSAPYWYHANAETAQKATKTALMANSTEKILSPYTYANNRVSTHIAKQKTKLRMMVFLSILSHYVRYNHDAWSTP
jgi:hypothetical protein